MLRKTLLVLLIVLTLAGCTKTAKTPKDAISTFLSNVQDGNYEKAAECWDFNYKIRNENIDIYMQKKDEVVELWKSQYKLWKKTKTKPRLIKIKYINKKRDVATALVRWKPGTFEEEVDVLYAVALIDSNWRLIGTVRPRF